MDYKEKYKQALERARQFSEKPYLEDSAGIVEYIFPELAESENEKIRKALLNEFIHLQSKGYKFAGLEGEEIIAWLEKQGAKVSAIEGFETEFERQVSGFIASAINKEYEYNQGYVKWTANALLNYAKHELEKQGEQKPNPCENCGIATNNCQNFPCAIRDSKQKPTDEEMKALLRTEYEKGRADAIEEMQNPTWSEEDETVLNNLIYALANDRIGNNRDEYVDWLKSLRPQNTWKPSDELDEASYQVGIKRVLENPESYGLTKYNWKPSDEQMNALNDVISSRDIKYDVLSELWKDLKNLKE